METKICSYTESSVRLQLVKVKEGSDISIELRFNRRRVFSFPSSQAYTARLAFSHFVNMICVDRNTSGLSNLTS